MFYFESILKFYSGVFNITLAPGLYCFTAGELCKKFYLYQMFLVKKV